jgi:integrase
MPAITDIQLRQWLRAGKPLAKAQGEVAGLTFTLSRTGTASWILRFRHGGKPRELTIGQYPEITLSEAKRLARQARAQIQQGIDPARQKRLDKLSRAGDMTVSELVTDYQTKVLPTLAAQTQRNKRTWLADIEAALGPLAVRDLTGADVVSMIEKLGKQRGVIVAEKALMAFRGLIEHALARRIVSADPSAGIKVRAICGAKPPTRQRLMLSESELRILLAPGALPEPYQTIIGALLATAVRVSELAGARWEHVDLEGKTWTIPASKTSRDPFTQPLSEFALAKFKHLHRLACSSAWVLPAVKSTSTNMDTGLIRLAINNKPLEGVRPFLPHDLRSTARSHFDALGINPETSERILNHRIPGVVGIYGRHDYMDERRRALDLWGEYLGACEAGREWAPTTSNVVPIRA